MNDGGDHGKVVPRFSVITVCFNAIDVLPSTVDSLRSQSCADYEWVVVDGASTDGSAEWLALQKPDVFISEPDRGIYDAMNKALSHARGQYLFFLNAGDLFADGEVLSNLADELNQNSNWVDLLYGDVVYFGDAGYRRKRFHWLSRSNLIFGDLCHQAVFVRRELFSKFGLFDLAYRYNADFDWFIRVFRGEGSLRYIRRDIVHFHDAGAHVQAGQRCRAERDIVRAKYCNRIVWIIGHLLLRIELKIRRLIGEEVG